MDRMDAKYAFRIEMLELLLEQMKPTYQVLEVNGHRISRYESVYFDTNDFELFHKHHNERANRYKIRFRKYVESDLSFFEIKFKNNKGRTIKNRIKQAATEGTIANEAEKFLQKKTCFSARDLEPKLGVDFYRITFVNRFRPERVTFDLQLTFKNNGVSQTMNNLVIAETKQERSGRSEFVRLMKQHHIREGSLSKYCYGISCLNEGIKNNNFKPDIKRFNKLLNDTTTST